MRVASVQFEAAPGDKRANLAKIRAFVERAAAQHIDLVVCPECCITGYWFLRNLSNDQITALAEPVPGGPSVQAVVALARQHGITIGAGLIELGEDGELYNTYVVALPDGRT